MTKARFGSNSLKAIDKKKEGHECVLRGLEVVGLEIYQLWAGHLYFLVSFKF